MEYKLIMAVSGFPSLYDMNSPTYRDLNMRSDAWRQVAEIVGVPGEFQNSAEIPARTSALTREHFRCGREGKLSKHVKHSDFHQRKVQNKCGPTLIMFLRSSPLGSSTMVPLQNYQHRFMKETL